jgi:hypothetical protein
VGVVTVCSACALALVAAGCASERSSDAAFRTEANRICREVDRQTRSVDFSSRSGFAKGLAGMRAGVKRLARLHPPAGKEHTYRDLLAKLRDINGRLAVNEARLLRLQRGLKRSSGHPARTIEQFRALIEAMGRDGLRAAADSRTLGVGVCATDLSGGAPLAPPLGTRERST